jgi:hypothetical protein
MLDLLSRAPVIVVAGVAAMVVATRDLVGGEVSPHPHRKARSLARHRRTSAHLRAYTLVVSVIFLALVILRFAYLGA